MNLKEFLSLRKECPFCQSQLTTHFQSRRLQSIRYEEDRLVAVIDMNDLQHHSKDYKVGYSFDMNDNSVYIEFFSYPGKKYEQSIHTILLERFREMDKNISPYYFIRKCGTCRKYRATSNSFKIDLKNGTIRALNGLATMIGDTSTSSIELHDEWFSLTLLIKDDEYKVMTLSNYHSPPLKEPTSIIRYWRGDYKTATYDYPIPVESAEIKLPFIPFVSAPETSERINKLITFS
jgi:hypothetical protein